MAALSLERIGHANLVDEIAQRLENQIAKGVLRPGDQLPPERDLCDQLGVSRTSLRNAVQRLAERGLLSVEVGRGTFVRQPNSRQLSERMALLLRLDENSYWKITEARHVIETRIAALAALRRSDADLAAMREALERMDAAMDDALTFIDVDEHFHMALTTAAGNEVLATLSQTLQSLSATMRKQIFSIVAVSATAQQYHWQIYDAVKRGSAEEAHAAMEGHLNEMESYVRSRLSAEPDPPALSSDDGPAES